MSKRATELQSLTPRTEETQKVKNVELLDIGQQNLKELREEIESGRISNYKELLLEIMGRCKNIMPDRIASRIGSFVNDDLYQKVTWDSFLQILEEEVGIRTKLSDQLAFCNSTLVLAREFQINLSSPAHQLFYTDYQVNFWSDVPDTGLKGRPYLLAIVNDSFLAVVDRSMRRLCSKVFFKRVIQGNEGQVDQKRIDRVVEASSDFHLSSIHDSPEKKVKFKQTDCYFDILRFIGDKKISRSVERKNDTTNDTKPGHNHSNESGRTSFVLSEFKRTGNLLSKQSSRGVITRDLSAANKPSLERVNTPGLLATLLDTQSNLQQTRNGGQQLPSINHLSIPKSRMRSPNPPSQQPASLGRSVIRSGTGILNEQGSFLKEGQKDPTKSKRISILMPFTSSKQTEEARKIDHILFQMRSLSEDPKERKKAKKLFQVFKTTIDTRGTESHNTTSSNRRTGEEIAINEYQDGDSLFEDLDLDQIDINELVAEHKFRKGKKLLYKNGLTFRNKVQKFSKEVRKITDYEVTNAEIRAHLQKKEAGTQSRRSEKGEDLTTRPKGMRELLRATSYYHWKRFDLVIVGFLTRELVSYSIAYEEDWLIKKVETVILEDFCSMLAVMECSFTDNKYYLAMVINYTKLEIYSISNPSLEDGQQFLKKSLQRSHLTFSLSLCFNPRVSLQQQQVVVANEDKSIRVYSQTNVGEFKPGPELHLHQQFRPTTIAALDYSAGAQALVAGTGRGDVYLFDSEVTNPVYKYTKTRSPVLGVRIVHILNTFFVFWGCNKLGVFDLVKQDLLHELSNAEELGIGGLNKSTDASWWWLPRIDEEYSHYYRRAFASEKERTGAIVKEFEVNMRKGRYSLYFGNSTFSRYALRLNKDKEFDEAISRIKMMEKRNLNWALEAGTDSSLLEKIMEGSNRWIYSRVVFEEESLILLNDKKLLVYLNYQRGLIVKYSLVDLEGELVTIQLLAKGRDLLLANAQGKALVINLRQMNVLKAYQLRLAKVFAVEALYDESFDLVIFNMPDELYCVKATPKAKKQVLPDIASAKEVLSFRMDKPFLDVKSDQSFIYCLLETYRLCLFNKKSMRMVKEFNLSAHLHDQAILSYSRPASQNGLRRFVSCQLTDACLFIALEAGALLVVKLNPASIGDITLYQQQFPTELSLFTLAKSNLALYVWEEDKHAFHAYKLDPLPSVKFACVPSNIELQKIVKNTPKGSEAYLDTISKWYSEEQELQSGRVTLFKSSHMLQIDKPKDTLHQIYHLREKNQLLMIPSRGTVLIHELDKSTIPLQFDVYQMIKQNRTWDQKRQQEESLMNMRNILRTENRKKK